MEFNNLIMLMQTMAESVLTEFQYEENGVKIYLSKSGRPEMHPGGLVPFHPGCAAAPGPFAGWGPNGSCDAMQQQGFYAEGTPAGIQSGVHAGDTGAGTGAGGNSAESLAGAYTGGTVAGFSAGANAGGPATGAPAGNIVTSPLVGVFYAAPAEDAAPFVSVGDKVKKGQQLAIVEAMKLMNEIECEFDGTIAEILVENGQAVEYGQPLFRIV